MEDLKTKLNERFKHRTGTLIRKFGMKFQIMLRISLKKCLRRSQSRDYQLKRLRIMLGFRPIRDIVKIALT